jgi:hypothetical protein
MKSLEDLVRDAMEKRKDEILKHMQGSGKKKNKKGGNFLSGLANKVRDVGQQLQRANPSSNILSNGGRLLDDDLSESDENIGAGRKKHKSNKVHGDGGNALAVFRLKVEKLREKHPNMTYREAQKKISKNK